MDKNIFIYALVDPRNNEIKYIGATKEGENRYKRHLRESYLKKSTLKNNWIKSLRKNGLKPKFEILEYCNLQNLGETEEFYIRYFKYIGFKLLNHENGGYGIRPKNLLNSEEKKRKASISQTKYPIIDLESKEIFLCVYDLLKKYPNINYNTLRSLLNKNKSVRCYGKYFCYLTPGLDADAELARRKNRLKNAYGKHTKKPVMELSTGIIYSSVKEASIILGIDESNIHHKMSGRRNLKLKGFSFKYV